jgi:serine/threonine protein kinase
MIATDTFDLVGKTLDGKYAVEAVADQCGFSTIYRAQHLLWHQKVAIKVFRFDDSEEEVSRLDLLEGFLQEGSILAQLSCRSTAVCQARDTGAVRAMRPGTTEADDPDAWAPFLVLEWLDGCSLSALLKEEAARGARPRSLDEAIAFLAPVASAISLAHERGITHRDLKPSNIFVLREAMASTGPRVKLLDFAVAKVSDPARLLAGPSRRACDTLTRLFTPAFGAPEQFNEAIGETGPWTDVFALGLILTRLVTGKSPLQGPGSLGNAQHCLDATARPTPRTLGARVSDGVDRVFERALALQPGARYASAGLFWSALQDAVARETTVDEPTELRHPPSGIRMATVSALAGPSVASTAPGRSVGGAAVAPRPSSLPETRMAGNDGLS